MGDIPIKRTESYSGLCIGGPLDGRVLENHISRVTVPVRDGWGKDPHGVDIPVYGAFEYEWREYGAIKVWVSPKEPAPSIENKTLQLILTDTRKQLADKTNEVEKLRDAITSGDQRVTVLKKSLDNREAEIKSLEKAHDVTLEAFEIAKRQVETLTKVINDVRRELKSHNYPFDVVVRPLAHAVDAAIDTERERAHEREVKLLGRFIEKILKPGAPMLPASEIRPEMIEQSILVCFNAIDGMRGRVEVVDSVQSTRAETLYKIGRAVGVLSPLYDGKLNDHVDRVEGVIIDRIHAIQDVNEKTFASVRAPLENENKELRERLSSVDSELQDVLRRIQAVLV